MRAPGREKGTKKAYNVHKCAKKGKFNPKAGFEPASSRLIMVFSVECHFNLTNWASICILTRYIRASISSGTISNSRKETLHYEYYYQFPQEAVTNDYLPSMYVLYLGSR